MSKWTTFLFLFLALTPQASAGCDWSVLEDSGHAVDIEKARQLFHTQAFEKRDPQKISYGFSRSRLWVHADCTATAVGDKSVGVIEYGFLDRIHGYRSGETSPSFVIGDRENGPKIDEFAYRLPVFHLDGDSDLFIKIETSGSLQAPITMMTESDYHTRVKWESLLLGVYYGIFVSLFLYNFCLWAISKVTVYGRYSMFVGLYGLFQLSANGFMNLLDLNLFVWLRNDGLSLSILGSQGALLLFAARFLSIKASNLKLGKLAEAAGYTLLIGGLILSVTVNYSYVSSFSAIVALIVPVLVLILGVIQVTKRNFVAMVFVVAQITYLGGVAMLGAKNLGLVEPSFFANYAVQFGSAFEMILLSLGLGLLIKKQNRDNHDLTVSKMRSQAVVRTAKMLAHDIRGPLRQVKATIGAIQNAGDESELRNIQTSLVNSSNHAWRHLDHMLADFMEFGDELRLNLVESDLVPIFRGFEEDYLLENQNQNIKFKYDLNYSGNISFDPYRIRRVLTNIVANAAEATNNSTTITISTRAATAPGFVEITIHNTGSTIKKRDLEKIFEPFFTEGKVRGTGLGLAIVAHIIKSHKGTIAAQSTEQGTTFLLTLPIATSSRKPASAMPAREISAVILDDCPFVLESWRSCLQAAKLDCFQAPEKLYQAIRDRKLNLQEVDLIVVDRWFNDQSSEDGIMAVENLRNIFGFKGAIFMSSDDQSASKVDHVINGRIDKKPRSIEQLLSVR